MAGEVIFLDVPGEQVHEKDAVVFKTRINTAWQQYLDKTDLAHSRCTSQRGKRYSVRQQQGRACQKRPNGKPTGLSLEERAAQYQPQKPQFTFEQLIVPEAVYTNLMLATKIISLERRVFDDWGLRKIEPFPRSALNFYGEPGTGKTLAAHALAAHLGREILLASYGQIESMYHGEGPKNVEAVFYAAQRDKALLFIDEADSLLSKRLTNVTQGSEQAINSMRSAATALPGAVQGRGHLRHEPGEELRPSLRDAGAQHPLPDAGPEVPPANLVGAPPAGDAAGGRRHPG